MFLVPMLDVSISVGTPLSASVNIALKLTSDACVGFLLRVAPASTCHHPSISHWHEKYQVHPVWSGYCASVDDEEGLAVLNLNAPNLSVEVLCLG